MKKNQIEIYATLSDLAGVAAAVEVDAQVYYTVCGLFDTAALTQFRTFPEVTPSLYVPSWAFPACSATR